MRPRLLDLFCGAGGCSVGYQRAGFDVTGVDIEPQPRYPFEFVQADALTYPLDGFDAHAGSPPCQDHIRGGSHPVHGTGWMLAATRERFQATDRPWVIENVPGSPMRADYELCGCMFGLELPDVGQLVRKRWFETSWHGFDLRSPCHHSGAALAVTGHGAQAWVRQKLGYSPTIAQYREIMGIDWTNRDELSQAIPPAYTEYIGTQLLSAMNEHAA